METVKYLSKKIRLVPISQILPNPSQPRRYFDQEALKELSASIKSHGILQPLTVQKSGFRYTLVAGERRLRAAEMAGLDKVPCVLVEIGTEESAFLALIENLQRSDLHYMEEAVAIAKLISTYSLSQEEVATRLGKSQSAIANKLRLLRLSEDCVKLLRTYQLTERHARTLLRLTDPQQRFTTLQYVGEHHLNVAQTEEYVERLLKLNQTTEPARRAGYIIKDVRLFLNSIRHSIEIMQKAGVDAKVDRQETEETITVTVHIPKKVSR